MTKKEFHALLGKYLMPKCSPEEEKLVNQWYEKLSYPDQDAEPEPSVDVEKRLWQRISQGTSLNGDQPIVPIELPQKKSTNYWKWVGIAASVMLVMAIGYILSISPPSISQEHAIPVAGHSLSSVIIQNNDTKVVKPVRLDDGSLVVLQPNSEIRVYDLLRQGQRKVELHGEAFFDIARDESRPFLVYSHELVIKVLGTSFNIRARQEDKTVVVDVKSGKVAVYLENHSRDEPLYLTPNQQVVYNRDSDDIIQKLQENPQVIIPETEIKEMAFDEAPVNMIFEAIEKAYGVDLVFDKETFSNCRLTTRLSNEGLYERLQIICRALGATYQTTETKVHIDGTGCN